MTLLRTHLGAALRSARIEQGRTLRDVAKSARVSLGYLSEVERGQKEPSSELLNAICEALNLSLNKIVEIVLVTLNAENLSSANNGIIENITEIELARALHIEEAA